MTKYKAYLKIHTRDRTLLDPEFCETAASEALARNARVRIARSVLLTALITARKNGVRCKLWTKLPDAFQVACKKTQSLGTFEKVEARDKMFCEELTSDQLDEALKCTNNTLESVNGTRLEVVVEPAD